MAPFLFLHHYMDATGSGRVQTAKRQPESSFCNKRVVYFGTKAECRLKKGNLKVRFCEKGLFFQSSRQKSTKKRQPEIRILRIQVASSESSSQCWFEPHGFLAGQRAAAPLWPDVCPVPRGGGAVMGLCRIVCGARVRP